MQGPPGPYTYRPSLPAQLYANLCVWIDQRSRLAPVAVPLGLAVMIGDRVKLRQKNLHDTGGVSDAAPARAAGQGHRVPPQRMPEGTFNDLHDPRMGAANTRFGRNVPERIHLAGPRAAGS